MGFRDRKRAAAAKAGRGTVPAQAAMFLTVGIPADAERGRQAIRRAGELLERHGFTVGITSDEAVLAKADEIEARNERRRRDN